MGIRGDIPCALPGHVARRGTAGPLRDSWPTEHPLRFGDALYGIDQFKILWEVLLAEPGLGKRALVVGSEWVTRADSTSEEASPEENKLQSEWNVGKHQHRHCVML